MDAKVASVTPAPPCPRPQLPCRATTRTNFKLSRQLATRLRHQETKDYGGNNALKPLSRRKVFYAAVNNNFATCTWQIKMHCSSKREWERGRERGRGKAAYNMLSTQCTSVWAIKAAYGFIISAATRQIAKKKIEPEYANKQKYSRQRAEHGMTCAVLPRNLHLHPFSTFFSTFSCLHQPT